MAVTDQNLCNELQFHLLETPNNGASYGSGLYTAAEVAGRLNFRADLFNKLTDVYLSTATANATSGTKSQDLSSAVSTFIDLVDVFYSSDNGTTYTQIPEGSSIEGDKYITDQTAVALPSFYTLDTASVLTLIFFPAPTFTGSNGKIKFLYSARLGTLPATPNGSSFSIPDDFTPFIKYGALADLFMKSGETYDPARANIAEALFQLGVEATKGWLTGEST
jgi:hypothetical protein